MSKSEIEQHEVRSLENAAWDLKDTVADLHTRKLSAPDRATLASVQRDLRRLHDRVLAVRDKRKRGNGATDAEVEP